MREEALSTGYDCFSQSRRVNNGWLKYVSTIKLF